MKEIKKIKVRIEVTEYPLGTEDIFICGNIPSLGLWNVEKSKPLKKDKDNNFYYTEIYVPYRELVSYKILADKDWDRVMLDEYGYDMDNYDIYAPLLESKVIQHKVVKFKG